jgi:hypothetical protein
MKHIRQFRYYGETDNRNYPSNEVAWNTLVGGNIFRGYGAITHLGIQALPGTKFYLNGGNHGIIIGDTGIYELELERLGCITGIRFDEKSLKLIQENKDVILIDIVYEGAVR